jgi:hypothetical protein
VALKTKYRNRLLSFENNLCVFAMTILV